MKKILATLLFLLLSGCASVPSDPEALAQYKADNDPLEPMNRKIMAFNSVADEYLLHPIASGYRAVTTPEMRKGMRAFVGNLKTPLSVVNNVLQLNFTDAGKGISRFVINSTLGVFGFFDVATRLGIQEKSAASARLWRSGASPKDRIWFCRFWDRPARAIPLL